MSTDAKVTKDLIETLEDGRKGFALAADHLSDSDSADLADLLRGFAEERGRFADELRSMAAAYGDHIEESGSLAGTLHRGWLKVKDMVPGSDAHDILEAVETGEDHAVAEYRRALETEDLSGELRATIERQQADVIVAHLTVRGLRDGVAA
jgi:uncharacterized protein (TIGR02284 family)